MEATAVENVSSIQVILTSVIPFVIVFFVMYILIIRPQQKKESDRQDMLDSLKKGDKVFTQGGVVGVVSSFKDKNIVVLTVSDSLKISVVRTYIVDQLSSL